MQILNQVRNEDAVITAQAVADDTLLIDAQMAAALASAPDIAATTTQDWAGAVVSHTYPELKAQLKTRIGRPPVATPKTPLALRLDQDIVAAFKATGRGWQTRLNDLLRKHLHEVGS